MLGCCSIKEPSYNGGGNLTFNGTLEGDFQFSARLFEGKLLLADSPVHFTYSVSHFFFVGNW